MILTNDELYNMYIEPSRDAELLGFAREADMLAFARKVEQAARMQALEEAATLIESTELSGLNKDIQLQVLIGKMLMYYARVIRELGSE